jgi:hypothetical protein
LLNPDYRDMLSALSEEGVEFLLVGGYALAAHGLPRATGDLDVWVNPTSANARRTWCALARFGAPLDQVNEGDFATCGIVFQIGVVPRRVDVITSIEGVNFGEAWPKRIQVELEGLKIPVIGREDFIRNKRALGRAQDVADVARLEEAADESDG